MSASTGRRSCPGENAPRQNRPTNRPPDRFEIEKDVEQSRDFVRDSLGVDPRIVTPGVRDHAD